MSDTDNRLDPEPESPEHEQYVTYARREVINVVEEIVESRSPVTVYFSQGEEYFVTNLLQVNPEFEELVFDCAPQEAMNRRIAESKLATFVTFLDQIKVQFNALRIEATSFGGKPALRTRLPNSLMRLQRRNFYRVPAPVAKRLQCEIPLPGGATAQFAVRDLSVGGLAMLAGPAKAEFSAGMVFHDCKIELPGHGSVSVSLEVRNDQGGGPAGISQRYGCQFLDLPGPVVSLIQRYINQLERDRRSLS
ncbi:MAG TPA: flagellar brake protein [Burkholderiales bacterium]|jgi:c-di-GMP-binding flagellar brake protein YcgR|nr:flagellar brake protein [Burkholderiales bacterium]